MSVTVHVLGTAQDGGFPHAGCGCASCDGARKDPARARRVSCIGVVGESGKCLMVDATPDFAEQQAALAAAAGREPPHVDALILTHAHIGHYLGLEHTFSGGCGGGSCYSSGDLICDTNAESQPEYNCATSSTSCGRAGSPSPPPPIFVRRTAIPPIRIPPSTIGRRG